MHFNRHRLTELRTGLGMSIYGLSLDMNVESSTIHRVEKGIAKEPSFDLISKFAKYFRVPVDEFRVKDILPEKQCDLSDEELINRCEKIIPDLCRTSPNVIAHTPVNVNADTDVLLFTLVDRFKKTKRRAA